MPQTVFTLLALAIGLVSPLVGFIAFCHHKYDFVAAFFANQSILSQEYDFIIVGGGSAGSVLAARLSEDPMTKVLLLEHGSSPPPLLSSIPVLGAFFQKSPYDWQYETVPQSNACKAMMHKKCQWPRGKMLGGSSGLNYLFYVRGDARDFNHWEDNFGLKGWNFDDIFPYFLRSEKQLGSFKNDDIFHNTQGELPVRDNIYVTKLARAFEKMAERHNLTNPDLNRGYLNGFAPPQFNIDENGNRGDTYSSFLRDIEGKRPNLTIVRHAQVARVLFDGSGKAKSVEVDWHGKISYPSSRKEIILSSGTIGSPFILMHSGIGSSSDLTQIGIPTIVDNPEVGENLQDHVTTLLGPFLIDKPVTFNMGRLASNPYLIWQYIVNGTGPLTTTVACDSLGFIQTDPDSRMGPDIQYHINSVAPYSDYGAFFYKIFGFVPGWWNEFYAPHYAQDAVTILPIVLHPKSRGRVWLRSSSPDDAPLIDPRYLTHPEDVKTLIKAIKTIIEMIENTPELKDAYPPFRIPSTTKLPMCKDFIEDAYWECFVRHLTMTMYHPTGTCAMGKVVDSDFRVFGVDNLRVVDASVMPEITSGNTNAPVIMLAEKASDVIRNHWGIAIFNEAKRFPSRATKDEL